MILTSDKKHVQIFYDEFVVDKELTKWQRINALREIIDKKIMRGKLKDKKGHDLTKAINDLFKTGELTLNEDIERDEPLEIEGDSDTDMDLNMSMDDYEYTMKYHDGKIPTYSDIVRIVKDSEKNESLTEFNVRLNSVSNKMLKKAWYSGVDDESFDISGTIAAQSEKPKTAIGSFLAKRKKAKEEKEEQKKEDMFDVAGFFNQIKLSSKNESDKYVKRLNEYVNSLAYAERMGQDALKEKLFKEIIINKYESLLYAKNMLKAISEDTIVKFALNCPKGLSICYIANYTRFIPKEAMDKKLAADELEIFDNYCVMYYDKGVMSYKEMTQREKEREANRRRDPILFGMINGSKKLYFIADWIDDNCDLTFDKIIDIVGKGEVEKDYIKSKIEIPTL